MSEIFLGVDQRTLRRSVTFAQGRAPMFDSPIENSRRLHSKKSPYFEPGEEAGSIRLSRPQREAVSAIAHSLGLDPDELAAVVEDAECDGYVARPVRHHRAARRREQMSHHVEYPARCFLGSAEWSTKPETIFRNLGLLPVE